MADDAQSQADQWLDSIDPRVSGGGGAPRAPQLSAQDQADKWLDSIDPRVSGWGAPKGSEPANESSAFGAFARSAERSALPTAGGLAGAAGGASAGAEIGAVGGPVGALAGGLVGGVGGAILGAGAVDAAQNWSLSKLPTGAQKFLGGTEEDQKADFGGHPFFSILGGITPYLLTANPGFAGREVEEGATALAKLMSNKYAAAGLSGLTMGGITLGQEAVHGEKPDWTEIGINTALGTFWSRPNALGARIMGGPEAAGARIGKKVSEAVRPTPENVTLADAGDQKVGPAPGVTEDVATGQAEMAPAAEAQVRDAARAEQTLTEPPKVANPVELARAAEPKAFNEYEGLEHRRETFRAMIDDADELGDLEGARAAQAHLAATEKEMDGISPDIRDAIARVAESKGTEAIEPRPFEPVPDLATDEMKKFISDDVARQLHAAGRPEEEAQAAGELIAARYATRASIMNGEIGTAEDLYRREGAVIRGGDSVARKIVPTESGPTGGVVPAVPAEAMVAEPPGADIVAGAQAKAQRLGLANLLSQMTDQGVSPAEIADFIGKKMGADEISAFTSAPKPARVKRAQAKAVPIGLAQSGATVKAKIKFTPGELRPTITLTRNADVSSFLHETGHDFLEQMARDSAHEAAPQFLKDDIAAVRQWVGNKGGSFKTREHEKFARGFEQYLREGTAPTAGLARVFHQFKSWLVQIYRTIKGLGDPISPEIRRVFDRMLTEPERPAIVAPGRQPGTSLADVHEADALSTLPHEANATADRIVAEKERAKSELPAEIQEEHARKQAEVEAERARASGIEPAAETGSGAQGGGNVPGAGGEAGNEPGGGGGGAQLGAQQPGGGGPVSEGTGAGPEPESAGAVPGSRLDNLEKAYLEAARCMEEAGYAQTEVSFMRDENGFITGARLK